VDSVPRTRRSEACLPWEAGPQAKPWRWWSAVHRAACSQRKSEPDFGLLAGNFTYENTRSILKDVFPEPASCDTSSRFDDDLEL
jgi:hypothetical protein